MSLRDALDLSPDEITSGPLHRVLVVLATPLLVQHLVRVAGGLVDMFWLGRYSGDAVAAVGLAMPVITFVFIVALAAPVVGTQILASQRVGADDETAAQRVAANGIGVSILLALVVGVAVAASVEPLVAVVIDVMPASSGSDAVISLAAAYLQIIALGAVVSAPPNVIESAFVGWGDSRAALYINAVSAVGNVFIDPLLIFGLGPFPALGVRGAALASVAGSATALLLALVLVASGRRPIVSRAAAEFDRGDLRELFDVGAAPAAQSAAKKVMDVIFVSLVLAVGGAAALTAYVVGTRVSGLAVVPAKGLRQAGQSVVGQNLGADQPDRARRATWVGVALAAAGLTVVGVVQWTIPGALVTVLAPEVGSEGFDLAVRYLRIFAYGYPAIGAMYLLEAGFNGAGRTQVSLASSLVRDWVVRLPLAGVGAFALGYGVLAVFWSIPASNVVIAVALGLYYTRATRGGLMRRAAEGI